MTRREKWCCKLFFYFFPNLIGVLTFCSSEMLVLSVIALSHWESIEDWGVHLFFNWKYLRRLTVDKILRLLMQKADEILGLLKSLGQFQVKVNAEKVERFLLVQLKIALISERRNRCSWEISHWKPEYPDKWVMFTWERDTRVHIG